MTPTSKPEQAASVDQLITTFKRRGHFDILRKSALQAFQSSKNGEELITRLEEIVRAEVQKDSNLLQRDRSKSAILIAGAVDRAGTLDKAKQGRDTVFEEQAIQEKVKAIITELLAKSATANDHEEGL